MTTSDLIPLLPYLVIACTGLVAMLLLSIHRSRMGTLVVTVAGLAVAVVAAVWVADPTPRYVTSLLVVDNFGLFFTILMCLAGIAVALLAYDYWPAETRLSEEFYLLLLFAVLGSAVLAGSVHFASFFLGLETLSVSLYAMIAYQRTEHTQNTGTGTMTAIAGFPAIGGFVGLGIEAGIKYLILAAVSAAFLLFGMALVYMESGSLLFSDLARSVGEPTAVLAVGVCMILVGIGFKLALIPFHLWTPDVYQGAPVPTAAFVASVSKGAMFALLLRFFAEGDLLRWPQMVGLIETVAIISMFVGNLLALQQKNIKRILAYSSIAHMGYLLVALSAGGARGVAAAAFYFVFYFISIVGAFAVVAIISRRPDDLGDRSDLDARQHAADGHEAGDLSEYAGLAWHRPWLAAAMSAMLFSLAGIPLTVGFVGKFYLLAAGVGAGRWALVIALVLSSVIALYYYLRVIVTMFGADKHQFGSGRKPSSAIVHRATPLPSAATIIALCLLLLWLGVYPTPVIEWAQKIATGL